MVDKNASRVLHSDGANRGAPDLGSGDLTVVGVQISPSALMAHSTLAKWGMAPDWLLPQQAAALLEPGFDVDRISALIAAGSVDARRDQAGVMLVEKISLAHYQELIWRERVGKRHAVVN